MTIKQAVALSAAGGVFRHKPMSQALSCMKQSGLSWNIVGFEH